MTPAQEKPIGERIAALETGVQGMTTAIEKLTDKVDQLGDKMADKIAIEVSHAKNNIMTVVDTKADAKMTEHRLNNLERDMATKAPNESFKEIRSFIIGACLLVLVAFATGVIGLVWNTNNNNAKTSQQQTQAVQQVPAPVVAMVPTK